MLVGIAVYDGFFPILFALSKSEIGRAVLGFIPVGNAAGGDRKGHLQHVISRRILGHLDVEHQTAGSRHLNHLGGEGHTRHGSQIGVLLDGSSTGVDADLPHLIKQPTGQVIYPLGGDVLRTGAVDVRRIEGNLRGLHL